MLVTSIFSFSYNGFKRLLFSVLCFEESELCGKELSSFGSVACNCFEPRFHSWFCKLLGLNGKMVIYKALNPLPDVKISALIQIESNCRRQFNVTQNMKLVFHCVENTEKRRKCWLPEFFPALTIFSKGPSLRGVKRSQTFTDLFEFKLRNY